MPTRRDAMKTIGAGGVAAIAASAASQARVLGANDRMRVGVMGLNNRGAVLMSTFAENPGATVTHLCDVDARVIAKCAAALSDAGEPAAKSDTDVRRIVEASDLDALVIAAPDHWHAPAAIMALDAGKHVYIEKPCSHNPREGELLVAAQARAGKVVQMGAQQRSSAETIELISRIRGGVLGEIYQVDTWYANNRGSIGSGAYAPTPDWLDWDLWQGPAPRTAFHDNYVHYNWHWFWHWGTSETCNNAAHELDIARWAMGVGHPSKVSVVGARNFFTDDDWQMYDTLKATFEYPGGRSISWEGHSCNKVERYTRGRGAMIYGTNGSALVDRNGYIMWDLSGAQIAEAVAAATSETTGTGGQGELDRLHIENFLDAVRTGAAPACPIDEGHISTLMCHLANIAWRMETPLDCDPETGRITNVDAARFWTRDYEEGWAPKGV